MVRLRGNGARVLQFSNANNRPIAENAIFLNFQVYSSLFLCQ